MNGHHLKLLKELSKDNKLSQRELSKKLGVSQIKFKKQDSLHVHHDPCRDKKQDAAKP